MQKFKHICKEAKMPRRARIDIVGYYHIVNRVGKQRAVCLDDVDFKMFLDLLCSKCQFYKGY